MIQCTYCGVQSNALDHIIPVSYNQITRKGAKYSKEITVPCCHECNGTLSNKWLPTIAERAEELIKCYTKKYKSVLEQKHWTDEELDNLSGNLKKMIRGKVQAKRDIDERLEFLMVVQSMPDLTPDDVWNKYPEGTYTKFKNG